MLTAVPAEGYLALRQHRIILCAALIFFQGCVSPLPCPLLLCKKIEKTLILK